MSASRPGAWSSLDARDLLCPLPVIRTQQAVEGLEPGSVLEVTCTDPGARDDIPAWCRIHGHEVLAVVEGPDELVVSLRVGVSS